MKNAWKYVWTLLLAAGLWSCEEGDDLLDEEGYEVPATYTFTRDGASTVDYSGQTARLDMLIEIGTYIKGQISAQQAIDSTKVINMLSNSGNPFTAEALNNSGKQLLDKCADKDLMLSYVYELAAITADDTLALNPNRLYDKKGIEYWQLLEKGLMGSVFYSQVVSNYTLPSKIGDDQNIALADGKNYRPAEHHWDEAFGYFGVPVDFPTNTTGIRFYGKYCNDRDPLVGTNAIMNAFIKGRAAITHQDSPTRDAMAKEVTSSI
ncbi:MAG: DUF4856 domain-containing protein [Cytophagales bacterium]|nr:DUF4856 domain-containing protein [Cytophagales bacterium]